MRLRCLGFVTAVVLSACSSGGQFTTGGPGGAPVVDAGAPAIDAGTPPVDGGTTMPPTAMFVPATHPGAPQVVDSGGPVLTSPQFVPVFFSNEDPAVKTSVEDFLTQLGTSSYWQAVTQEYGVGPATMATPVELAETATGTLSDTDIMSWLAGKLDSNDPAFPAPGPNSIYVLHYPDGVTITAQGGQSTIVQSCRDIGGFHDDLQLDAGHGMARVAYVVMPRCASFDHLMGLDAITAAESHELVEAATDPYPEEAPAFIQVDQEHLGWMLALGGGEVGDLCAQDLDADTTFPGLPFVVQRSWSNRAALAGHDPCTPSLSNEVYFNAAAEQPDVVTMTVGTQSITTRGVKIPVGQSKTIPIDLFSDAATGGAWTVDAQDLAQALGGSPELSLSLNRASGLNGDQLQLTITVLKAGSTNTEPFFLVSSLGQSAHLWIGLVGQ